MDDYSWTTGGMMGVSHLRMIATGGFGEVHLVKTAPIEMHFNGKDFARKILRPWGSVVKEDIISEARAITDLRRAGNHRNIILILDQGWLGLFGAPSGCYFIDMEFCELTLHKYIYGVDERDILLREENMENNPVFVPRESSVELKLQNAWTIMSHIAGGTEFMHKHGQVHRDLKPRNILYSRQKNVWKIIDFGNTVEATSKNPHTSRYGRGTSGYRAPELVLDSASYTNKVDVWALGCILYELIMEAKAFDNDYRVMNYYHDDDKTPYLTPHVPQERFTAFSFYNMFNHLNSALVDLLARDWKKRPSATEAFRIFSSYSRVLEVSVSKVLTGIPNPREWKALLQKHPSEQEFLFELGMLYEGQTGQGPRNAMLIWASLVRSFPKNHEIYVRLAALYIQFGWDKHAIELLGDTVADWYEGVTQHQISDAIHKVDDSGTTMISRLEELITKQRTVRKMQNQLAGAYERQGMMDQAIGVWNHLIGSLVNRDLNDSLALAYRQAGDENAELALLEGLVSEEKSYRKVLTELGQLHVRKGDDRAAIQLWTDVLNRAYGTRKYLDEATEMFDMRQHQVPISALLVEYESQERLNWELFESLTEAYNKINDISGLITICQAALARHSGEAAWLSNKVSGVCTQSGDRDIYLAWKSLAEEHLAEKEKAIVKLAEVFEHLGNPDRCIRTWEEVVDRDPTSWRYQNELAEAYKRKGDINLEIQGWKNLINRHPKEGWWFEHQLAKAYAEKSDCEEARKGWAELCNKHPSDGWRLQHQLAAVPEKS